MLRGLPSGILRAVRAIKSLVARYAGAEAWPRLEVRLVCGGTLTSKHTNPHPHQIIFQGMR